MLSTDFDSVHRRSTLSHLVFAYRGKNHRDFTAHLQTVDQIGNLKASFYFFLYESGEHFAFVITKSGLLLNFLITMFTYHTNITLNALNYFTLNSSVNVKLQNVIRCLSFNRFCFI